MFYVLAVITALTSLAVVIAVVWALLNVADRMLSEPCLDYGYVVGVVSQSPPHRITVMTLYGDQLVVDCSPSQFLRIPPVGDIAHTIAVSYRRGGITGRPLNAHLHMATITSAGVVEP